MQWLDEWRALSSRIETFLDMAALFMSHVGADSYSVLGKAFLPDFQSINAALQVFQDANHDIPVGAADALRAYLAENRWLTAVNGGQITGVLPLGLLKARFEYELRDAEVTARNRAELAFAHLCRALVADEAFRRKWQEAFDTHETHCERLGSVHLLMHGLWAFKIAGAGAATDLVFPEPIEQQLERVQQTATALVLTEWKRVHDIAQVSQLAREAREQTDRYKQGLLGALEVKRTRYVVLVTGDNVAPPDDVTTGSIRFRHIVVAVNPRSASVPRKKSRRQE